MKMRATWQNAAMKNDTAYFHLESFAYFSVQAEKYDPSDKTKATTELKAFSITLMYL